MHAFAVLIFSWMSPQQNLYQKLYIRFVLCDSSQKTVCEHSTFLRSWKIVMIIFSINSNKFSFCSEFVEIIGWKSFIYQTDLVSDPHTNQMCWEEWYKALYIWNILYEFLITQNAMRNDTKFYIQEMSCIYSLTARLCWEEWCKALYTRNVLYMILRKMIAWVKSYISFIF